MHTCSAMATPARGSWRGVEDVIVMVRARVARRNARLARASEMRSLAPTGGQVAVCEQECRAESLGRRLSSVYLSVRGRVRRTGTRETIDVDVR